MPEALRLEGCAPEPLMGYLKALGVLRLLDEQLPSECVRGWWAREAFCIERRSLREQQLLSFFLDTYSPTPLLAPWNGGSGFYVKLDLDRFLDSGGSTVTFKSRDVVSAINAIETSTVERLGRYRRQVRQAKHALASLAKPLDLAAALAEPLRLSRSNPRGAKQQASKTLDSLLIFQTDAGTFAVGKTDKDEFVSRLRSEVLADDGLAWLDAALAMRTGQKKNRVEAPALGSGGNIGNSDFSARFAQMLAEVVPFRSDQPRPPLSEAWLRSALLGTPAPSLKTVAVDQFDPGRAGGANGTQGMEAAPVMNPWDYVLMLEGALALAGGPSRRLGTGRDGASFPFAVDSTPVGYASAGRDNTRGELWLPLWDRAAPFREVRYLLSEGRAEVGRERAWSGSTFAQAIAGLGVDRGIREFVRFEFQERLGKNYLATPVGRFTVPDAPLSGIELVRGLNAGLADFRAACRTKAEGAKTDPPARFPTALRRIDSAVFEFCKYGGLDRLADVLRTLGNAERELAVGDVPPDRRRSRRPLGGLPSEWFSECDDGSHEYRLARSIAAIRTPTDGKVPWLRSYLEPVEWTRHGWLWAGSEETQKASRKSQRQVTGAAVWSGRDLSRNLGAILIRRLMDAEAAGEEAVPLLSALPATLADVSGYLSGISDDNRLEELLWGLILVDRPSASAGRIAAPDGEFAPPLPRAYPLLKLSLLPGRLAWVRSGTRAALRHVRSPESAEAGGTNAVRVRPEPAMLARLRAGDIAGACEIAGRRLRAAGFVPLPGPHTDGSRRPADLGETGPAADRLLASLLFPIHDDAVDTLAQMVLRVPSADAVA